MHELSLMADLVDEVARGLASSLGDEVRVLVVRLEIGKRAGVMPEALRFCFDVCTRGTALEGASLDIAETGGTELRLKEVEVS